MQVEAGPIASSGRLQEVLRELAVAMDEAGLRELPHEEIAALGVTGAADHEEVMIKARRLAAARATVQCERCKAQAHVRNDARPPGCPVDEISPSGKH